LLHWCTEINSGNRNILHYLDDFLFGGEANTLVCENTLQFFRNICKLWGEAEDKAVEPVEVLLFLGIKLDTNKMELV
jgi:hypothetical protein